MKYFDVHCHIFPPNIAGKVVQQLEDYYGYKWEGTALAGDLRQSMRDSGVDKSVIFSSATKPAQVKSINDYIASQVAAFPDDFIGLGTLHPDFPDVGAELQRLRQLGLKGLKFHPDFQQFNIDDPKMLAIYEQIGDDLVLLFHVGDPKTDFSSPRRLARVLDAFPRLKIVAAHLGGYCEWDEAAKYLIGRNVYMDISSTIKYCPLDKVRQMVYRHGTDKILFASDYPAVRQARAIADVRLLALSAADEELIFCGNAGRLFGC